MFWSITGSYPHRSETRRRKRIGCGGRIRTIPACVLSGSIPQSLSMPCVSVEGGEPWADERGKPSLIAVRRLPVWGGSLASPASVASSLPATPLVSLASVAVGSPAMLRPSSRRCPDCPLGWAKGRVSCWSGAIPRSHLRGSSCPPFRPAGRPRPS
jgi:hypothetical protein